MSALKNGKESLSVNSRGLWNHSGTANQIWLGSSDGPRIWSIEANRTWICRHALVRATRSLIEFRVMHIQRSLWFWYQLFKLFQPGHIWLVIWFTTSNYSVVLNGSCTTNTHELCSNGRFVIWLAQAPWRHQKFEPMSCWVFQSLMNLVMKTVQGQPRGKNRASAFY